MSIITSHDGNHTTITVSSKFAFKDYVDFRKAYSGCPEGPATIYTVDLAGVDYIDSAALGMLVLLREYAGNDDASITIRGAKGMVRDALGMANYGALFVLE